MGSDGKYRARLRYSFIGEYSSILASLDHFIHPRHETVTYDLKNCVEKIRLIRAILAEAVDPTPVP
jgi:hypothetical protein